MPSFCRLCVLKMCRCPVGVPDECPCRRCGCVPRRPPATRFVKAQATMLHFPQAENSNCALAFPPPTKQALRGPQVVLPSAAVDSLPRLSPAVRVRPVSKKADTRTGICFFGAGDRTRPGTLSPAVDFESTTSTNSITPAGVN